MTSPKTLKTMSLKNVTWLYNQMAPGKKAVRFADHAVATEATARLMAELRKVHGNELIGATVTALLKGPLSYVEILAEVRRRFPRARTSLRSVQWYASKLRAGGIRLPERKRVRLVA